MPFKAVAVSAHFLFPELALPFPFPSVFSSDLLPVLTPLPFLSLLPSLDAGSLGVPEVAAIVRLSSSC